MHGRINCVLALIAWLAAPGFASAQGTLTEDQKCAQEVDSYQQALRKRTNEIRRKEAKELEPFEREIKELKGDGRTKGHIQTESELINSQIRQFDTKEKEDRDALAARIVPVPFVPGQDTETRRQAEEVQQKLKEQLRQLDESRHTRRRSHINTLQSKLRQYESRFRDLVLGKADLQKQQLKRRADSLKDLDERARKLQARDCFRRAHDLRAGSKSQQGVDTKKKKK